MSKPTRQHRVEDRDSSRRYFAQIPNILLKLGLNTFEVTLYLCLKQAAWESGTGKCEASTADLAAETGMSAGSVSKAKVALAQQRTLLGGKPLITVEEESRRGGKPLHIITLVDIWEENVLYFQARHARKRRSPDEVQPSPDEVQPSPDEVQPSPDEVQPSPDEVQPSPDERPSYKEEDPQDVKDTHTARAREPRCDEPRCDTHTERARADHSGAKSRHTRKICVSYAATRPTVNSPEGFGRTIWLSGDEDDDIDTWLSEEQRRAAINRRNRETAPAAMSGTPRPEWLPFLHTAFRARVNAESYDRWLAHVTHVAFDGGVVELGVPNEMYRDWIGTNYGDVIEEAIVESIGEANGTCTGFRLVPLSSDARAAVGA